MFVNLVTRECGSTLSDKYIAEVAKVLHGHQSHSSDDARVPLDECVTITQ
jgi:hypothetical protein